jgi:heavy metal sensor kinase
MSRSRRLSLRQSLTLWYTLILGLLIALSGAFIYRTVTRESLRTLDEGLLDISRQAFQNWLETRTDPLGTDWPQAIRKTEMSFAPLHPYIRVIAFSQAHEPEDHPLVYHAGYPRGVSATFAADFYNQVIQRDEETPLYMSRILPAVSPRPVRVLIDPNHDVLIEIAVSLDKTSARHRGILWSLLLSGAAVLLLASLGGNLILRRALQPVRGAAAAARSITAGDLSLRLAESGGRDEIGELIHTLNGMLERLDGAIRRIRRFSGDVSHELRTPLTIIRGEIEIALRRRRSGDDYRACLASILEETARLEKIIAELLLLARLEETPAGAFHGDVALDEVVLQVFESREKAALARKVKLGIRELTPLRVRGEASLLQQLLANLVDNAIRYTPAGGTVEIALQRQGAAALSVRDSGIGIPESALPHIFERFYVAEPSRSKASAGVGLGLAIAQWIAGIHHGTIEVQSKKGQGSTFTVLLPLAEEDGR